MFGLESLYNCSCKKWLLFVVFVSFTQLYGVATRNEIKLSEASEDIKLISQKIVKEYLYLSLNAQKQETKDSIKKSIDKLDENIRLIASVTKSSDAKDVLSFLVFSRDEISEIIDEKYNIDNALIMLDNSEVLVEGANSIVGEYTYKFSAEEKMLINVKYMSYLLQRISKYYMAIQAGINDQFILDQLQLSIDNFDKKLRKLKKYKYKEQTLKDVILLEEHWLSTRDLFLSIDKKKLANILYISSEQLDELLNKLKLYHSKNQ